MKNKRGITLIALILTIVLLVVMSGITVNALIGEHSIISDTISIKQREKENSIKEKLELAWKARLIKIDEVQVSVNPFGTRELAKLMLDLNANIGNDVEIVGMKYYETNDTFNVAVKEKATNEIFDIVLDGFGHVGRDVQKVDETQLANYTINQDNVKGNARLIRTATGEHYTELWISYYEENDVGTLVYASDPDLKWNSKTPKNQWDNTEEVQVNWLDNVDKIQKAVVLDKIIPKTTKQLFYNLEKVTDFEGLENIDYSYCKVIGEQQFYNCKKLKSIMIPNDVEFIDSEAFRSCDLNNITWSENLKMIGDYAFYKGLEFPNIPTGVGIPDSIYPRVYLPEGLEIIGNYAFASNYLFEIQLPNSLRIIGTRAFQDNNILYEITIPENVTYIGKGILNNCNIHTIYYNAIDASDSDYTDIKDTSDLPFSRNINLTNLFKASNKLIITNLDDADAEKILELSYLNLVIGEKVKVIPTIMFGYSDIKNLTIPDNVETIGKQAFSYGFSLESVVIGTNTVIAGSTATEIAGLAFYGCEALLSVSIGRNVSEIGAYAFANDSNLDIVNYNAINASANDIASSGSIRPAFLFNGKTLNIGEDVITIPDFLFWSAQFTSVTIPNNVTKIGHYAFRQCSAIETLTIGENVKSIGLMSFNGCTNMKTINYNAIYIESVYVSSGGSAYSIWGDTTGTLKIGSTVRRIPSTIFFQSSITSVEAVNGVEAIGSLAFFYCTSLQTVSIPSSITSIGNNAFNACTSLVEVNIDCAINTIEGSPWGAPSTTQIKWKN